MNFTIKKTRLYAFTMLLFTGIFLAACSIDSDPGTGTLKLGLTDAPANFDEVNIEILQVMINRDEDAEPENGEAENDDNGWYSIMDDSITINLLDYQNGTVLDLGEIELEAGTYNQVRLMLGDNNNVVIDGETFALTTPSAQQSGYKLNVQAEVEADQIYELVIDFDASQSIVVTGNNKFILKPVLRTVDLQNQGSISGTVLPLEAEPWVYAIMDQDTMGTQADEAGNFRIVGLKDGTYNVWIQPNNEAYVDSLIEGIEIEDGEKFEFEEDIELEQSSTINL